MRLREEGWGAQIQYLCRDMRFDSMLRLLHDDYGMPIPVKFSNFAVKKNEKNERLLRRVIR